MCKVFITCLKVSNKMWCFHYIFHILIIKYKQSIGAFFSTSDSSDVLLVSKVRNFNISGADARADTILAHLIGSDKSHDAPASALGCGSRCGSGCTRADANPLIALCLDRQICDRSVHHKWERMHPLPHPLPFSGADTNFSKADR